MQIIAVIMVLNVLIAILSDTWVAIHHCLFAVYPESVPYRRNEPELDLFNAVCRYARIRESADMEWKYSFTRMVLEYRTASHLPSPLNLFDLAWDASCALLRCLKQRTMRAAGTNGPGPSSPSGAPGPSEDERHFSINMLLARSYLVGVWCTPVAVAPPAFCMTR